MANKMTKEQQELARGLIECGAFKDKTKSPEGKGFRYKIHDIKPELPLFPNYMDLRVIRSFPRLLSLAASEYVKLIHRQNWEYDYLADIPTGATPFTTLVSHFMSMKYISPRGDKKKHGSGAVIDGIYQKGDRVVVVDDLVSQGASKLETLDILKNEGLVPAGVVVLINRQQGGDKELQKTGIPFASVFTLSELLDFYLSEKLMSKDIYEESIKYIEK